MKTAERLTDQIQKLPEHLQEEVLDFVQFLKKKSASGLRQEEDWWSRFSLSLSLTGLDDKEEPAYSEKNLKERWQ